MGNAAFFYLFLRRKKKAITFQKKKKRKRNRMREAAAGGSRAKDTAIARGDLGNAASGLGGCLRGGGRGFGRSVMFSSAVWSCDSDTCGQGYTVSVWSAARGLPCRALCRSTSAGAGLPNLCFLARVELFFSRKRSKSLETTKTCRVPALCLLHISRILADKSGVLAPNYSLNPKSGNDSVTLGFVTAV